MKVGNHRALTALISQVQGLSPTDRILFTAYVDHPVSWCSRCGLAGPLRVIDGGRVCAWGCPEKPQRRESWMAERKKR